MATRDEIAFPDVPPKGSCPLLDRLPQELRDEIVDWVLAPVPTVILHKWRPPKRPVPHILRNLRPSKRRIKRADNFLWPNFDFGGCRRPSSDTVRWKRSLMSMLLVNKQVYAEFMPRLYQRTVFCLGNTERSLRFLNALPRQQLAKIKHIRLDYVAPLERDSWTHATEMCIQIANDLVSIEHLQIDIELEYGSHRWIVPEFRYADARISMADIQESGWLYDIKVFRAMEKITSCRATIAVPRDYRFYVAEETDPRPYAMHTAGQNLFADDDHEVVAARYAEFYKALYESMEVVLISYIKSKPDPWDLYMRRLELFYKWRRDPSQVTGLYREEVGRMTSEDKKFLFE